jgi:hypothetical protein
MATPFIMLIGCATDEVFCVDLCISFVRLLNTLNKKDCVHHFDVEAEGFTSISRKRKKEMRGIKGR